LNSRASVLVSKTINAKGSQMRLKGVNKPGKSGVSFMMHP